MEKQIYPPPLLKYIHYSKEFTPREFEILNCLLDCNCNKEIAINLGIAYETVRVHRKKIYQKLKINNFAGLITWYLEQKNDT